MFASEELQQDKDNAHGSKRGPGIWYEGHANQLRHPMSLAQIFQGSTFIAVFPGCSAGSC